MLPATGTENWALLDGVKPLVQLRGLLARQLVGWVAVHVSLCLLPEQQQHPVPDVLAHGRGGVGLEPALGQEQGGAWKVCTTQLMSAAARVLCLTDQILHAQ